MRIMARTRSSCGRGNCKTMKDGKFLTMAIESSCDETAIAVVADGAKRAFNVISSQIDIFKNYGGVVPEIASRHHLENINHVMRQALDERKERRWMRLTSSA